MPIWGERFGFYIMMAILTLFISAKFGLNETTAGYIYSGFYASIYLLALVGGIIADKTRNYNGTIMWGLVVMSLGYLIIAIPTPTPVSSLPLYLTLTCVGLLVIAFGNGLFKGNLQALVGQMYDNKEFSAKRESGFQIFYMFINIGGFFAPFVAIGVRNWWLKVNNFDYNAKLPELCHEYLAKGEHMAGEGLANLTSYANSAYLDGTPVSAAGLHDFCNGYLDVFNRGLHYAFIAAIVMMLVSLVICNGIMKNLYQRVRPFHADPTFENLYRVFDRIYDWSFPSGHTSASFAAAVAIRLWNKKEGIGALVLAALISFSRLYLTVHYPTDVLASVVFGSAYGGAAYLLMKKVLEKPGRLRKVLVEGASYKTLWKK